MFKITNIKLSLKLQSISLDSVENVCEEKKIFFTKFSNFLVIKTKYTFVLFKENAQQVNHVNITKVPSFSEIDDSINFFFEILNIGAKTIKHQTVDNITANFSLNKTINLTKFAELYKEEYFITYKNETFSGLSIRFLHGTALLFHTGSVVVVGCKTIDNIKWIVKKIHVLTSII